jgi:hypothetical protein
MLLIAWCFRLTTTFRPEKEVPDLAQVSHGGEDLKNSMFALSIQGIVNLAT